MGLGQIGLNVFGMKKEREKTSANLQARLDFVRKHYPDYYNEYLRRPDVAMEIESAGIIPTSLIQER
jgi:hypothetical protein